MAIRTGDIIISSNVNLVLVKPYAFNFFSFSRVGTKLPPPPPPKTNPREGCLPKVDVLSLTRTLPRFVKRRSDVAAEETECRESDEQLNVITY